MAGLTGLAVSRDGSNNGTTPKGFRLAVAGMLAKNGGGATDVRKGILWDGGAAVVTGTAGMAYSIRAIQTVVNPTPAQGPIIVPNDAALSVATTAAPGSNSRIDIIWVRQHLVAGDGGADSDVIGEHGVTQGAAAAVPTAPAIPTGAVEIARATVPTGTTNTNSLTISQTHLWTAMTGAPIPVRNNTERGALTGTDGLTVFNLTTKVLERHDGTRWRRASTFAEELGSVLFTGTIAGNNVSTVNISFDSSLFTQPPIVTAVVQGGGNIINVARVDTITTTGARIVLANAAAASAPLTNVPVVWEARQATATAAAG